VSSIAKPLGKHGGESIAHRLGDRTAHAEQRRRPRLLSSHPLLIQFRHTHAQRASAGVHFVQFVVFRAQFLVERAQLGGACGEQGGGRLGGGGRRVSVRMETKRITCTTMI
jgi:hypothetical protein